MIDKLKRQSLKRIGMGAVAASAAGIAGHSMASMNTSSVVPATGSPPIADIQVSTRVSAVTNDLEVVVTNVGNRSTTITQLTPSVTVTNRGQFDFSQLFKDGDIALIPGDSVSVPMRAHAVQISALDTDKQRQSLSEALRRSFSVVTENELNARVTFTNGVMFS